MQIHFVESTSPDNAPVLGQNAISRNLEMFILLNDFTLASYC